VLVLSGCFADAPELEEGGGTTGSASCPVGSRGCPCTSGGACDAPLECHAQSQHCYDPECVLGAPQCPCADGVCFSDLLCIDDYCQPEPAGETGTMESTPGEATSTPAESTSTGASATTIEPEESGSTANGESDPTLPGESSTSAMPQTCLECFDEAVYGECVAEGKACFDDGTCLSILSCALEGVMPLDMCCTDVMGDTVAWGPLVGCVQAYCSTPCQLEVFCVL